MRVTGAGQALPHGFDEPLYLPAQVTPETSGATFQREGVELTRPHLVITRTGMGERVMVGDMLIGTGALAGRRFVVATPPRVFAGVGATDHASFVVDEVQFAHADVG